MSLMDYEVEVDFLRQMKRELLSVLYLGAEIPLEMLDGKKQCQPPLADDIDPDLATLFSFKILILDDFTRRLVAPLIRQAELQEALVTLHLQIDSFREAIPDTSAIYFVQPTEANFALISSNCRENLYDYVFIFFTGPASPELLRGLAGDLAHNEAHERVIKVAETNLNYFPLCSELAFLDTLAHQPSYTAKCAGSLLALFKNNNMVPSLFQVQQNSIRVNQVFAELSKRLRNEDEQSEFEKSTKTLQSWNRRLCMVIIVDRNIDEHSGLFHSWRYLSLIHDILGNVKESKISLAKEKKQSYEEMKESEGDRTEVKNYDLDFLNDQFLRQNLNKKFHLVAEQADLAFKEWKIKSDRISSMSQVSDISTKLNEALQSLPELAEQKKRLDVHMNLVIEANDQIKKRNIPEYIEIEKAITTSDSLTNSDFERLVTLVRTNMQGGEKSREDKLRVILTFLLASAKLKIERINKLMNEFQRVEGRKKSDSNAVLRALAMRNESEGQIQEIIKSITFLKEQDGGSESAALQGGSARSVMTGLAGMFKDRVYSSVKNAFAKSRNNILKLTVSQLMDGNEPQSANFKLCDYKSKGAQISAAKREQLRQLQTNVNNVVVMVIGGGSLYEHSTLLDLSQQTGRKILYVCDSVISPSEYLESSFLK